MKKTKQPARRVNDWETVSFKVLPEMKKKIEAALVIGDYPNEAEFFRALLRERFDKVK